MDRELAVLLVDVVISIILFFGAKYLTPDLFEDVKFLVAVLQPIVLALIGKYLAEDVTLIKMGIHPKYWPNALDK